MNTTTDVIRPTQQSPTTALPIVAVGGVISFWLAVLIGGAVQPGYSHLRDYISALAATTAAPYAWIGIAGIAALGVGLLAAALRLLRRLDGAAGGTGAALLGLAGLAVGASAFAQEDCSTALASCQALEEAGAVSGHHVIHNLVALAGFLFAALGLLVLAAVLRRTPDLAGWRWPTMLAGLFGLGVIAWMIVGPAGDLEGLVQRAFCLVVFGLPVLLVVVERHREPTARPAKPVGGPARSTMAISTESVDPAPG